ncbi:GNAT family protein [Streptomyces sp. NPDC046685]|uniref:GNAT family N-acetyltransferase n=1 Tax=Streptomyces sp. NPDC046685 TaxID=3157202 RepID=UPI0033E53AA2
MSPITGTTERALPVCASTRLAPVGRPRTVRLLCSRRSPSFQPGVDLDVALRPPAGGLEPNAWPPCARRSKPSRPPRRPSSSHDPTGRLRSHDPSPPGRPPPGTARSRTRGHHRSPGHLRRPRSHSAPQLRAPYPDQVQAIVDRSIASAQDAPRTEYCLAVAARGEHRLIGYARLATEPQQAATIGFALNPAEWGKGLGTETVHLLCGLGFKALGLHRIWAARSPLNEASARTLLRAGMTEDGRIRDHVFVHGAWRDSITYSILEHEWTPIGTLEPNVGEEAPARVPLSATDSGQER